MLIGCRPDVAAADAALAPLVTPDVLAAAVADVPDDWLGDATPARRTRTGCGPGSARRDAWLPPLVGAAAAGAGGRPPTRRRPAELAAVAPA